VFSQGTGCVGEDPDGIRDWFPYAVTLGASRWAFVGRALLRNRPPLRRKTFAARAHSRTISVSGGCFD